MDEPAPPTESVAPEPMICPNCGAAVTAEDDQNQTFVHCPQCGKDFLPAINEVIQDAEVEWEEPVETEGELDGLRIRQLVQLRRSAIRARTYAIVILVCCLVMAAQLILTDLQEVHLYGWDRWAIFYAISAGVMAIGATIASRKVGKLHRESKASSAVEVEEAPQFDRLSDGSHHITNLEQMQNPEDSGE